jgi:cytochrome c biogenesis protein CcdA
MGYFAIVAFVLIAVCLGAALFFMLRGGKEAANEEDSEEASQRQAKGMARALAFRVGFSIVLFLCVLVAWKLGYIQPTGIAASK